MAQLSTLLVTGASRLLSTLYCADLFTKDTITSSKETASHLAGNKGEAIINSTAGAGAYTMLAKLNSTNGYFTHGVYESRYNFYYTAKTTVEAGTNGPTKSLTLLDESGNSTFPGQITASTFKGNGAAITSLNASNVASGTLSAARLPSVTRSNTTSTVSPAFSGSFSVLDSVTTDSYGRVTAVNTKTVTIPANPNTDTKNTAGSTNTSSKIFLIGATSQAANPQTYSHDTAYVGTDGCLYSNKTKVSVEGHKHGSVTAVTLPVSGWSASAPYTQTKTVTGITADDTPIIGVLIADGTTAANVKLQSKAWGCVDRAVSGAGTITFYCYNKKPASDFTVNVKK